MFIVIYKCNYVIAIVYVIKYNFVCNKILLGSVVSDKHVTNLFKLAMLTSVFLLIISISS